MNQHSSYNRRDFMKALSAGAAALAMPQWLNDAEASGKRPNIVFIFADDWGWGDLGCYGNERVKSQNIDRLARQGLLFEQFYVSAAVCSPSRASILTGRFTNRHGIHSHLREKEFNLERGMPSYLDPNQPMLPRLLQAAGYATAHFGKWHLTSPDDLTAPTLAEYGFNDHRLVLGYGDAIHQQPGTVPGWKVWEDARRGWGPTWEKFRAKASELIFDEAIHFIESNKDKPFYVQTWLFDTHGRMTPTEKQMQPFKNMPRPYRMYYAAIADTDRHIGRLLKKLDELHLTEKTIVIFSSDNGPEDIIIGNASEHGVGDPGPFRGRKRSGYEGGIRMPFIIRWPQGTPAGRVNETTVLSGVDFLPTICALAGVKPPPWEQIDGEDMSEALRGKPRRRARPLFWDLREDVIGPAINASPKLIIRDGRWKLLMHPDGSDIELYDIVANPLEVDNLADTHPEVAKKLSQRLLKWKRNHAVVF